MRRNVGTSRYDSANEIYGFCCDIKDHGSRLDTRKGDFGPLFSPSDVTGGGPDIKFRIQDADSVSPSSQRSFQKSIHRNGQRSGHRSGQRSGYLSRHRGGYDNPRRNGSRKRNRNNPRVGWDDQPRGVPSHRGILRRDVSRTDNDEHDKFDEPMICKRCRGPLRWYLEDEIAVARDKMMSSRQETYNFEMEKNIKIAKKKGIR
ncbi:uncharacterized protein LOC122397426 [Colletes gigas]|uniref:uncharacterized protein LOC122397426 n=1 Tax=Colletes gigas TaxID=935657 RepID=UPI001C9A459B|nr:uncharacterized protein LOC122397426 [Colletes gigas]